MTLRHVLAALVTPLVWRVPGHGGRKLYGFARAEQASRIDLLLAAQRTPSLARRAAYLRHALGDGRTEALFQAILIDEQRHESYTRALLVELAGGEGAARAELRRAALWEAWRMWRRAGRQVAGAIYTIAMMVIYLVTGPIAALGLRAAKRPATWQLSASPAPEPLMSQEPPISQELQVPQPPLPHVLAELPKPAREAGR